MNFARTMNKNNWRIITTVIFATIAIPLKVQAENINHLSQLLNTKQCENCDLSNAGLVMTNLTGANLTGANLMGANLSRANLTGANLAGANLMGASLYGANLTGANLTGANLTSADFRNTYLVNANFQNTNLGSAYIQGAVGIPETAGEAEQFYAWALQEDKEGNYPAAMKHYNQAIELNPELAPAYLGRAIIKSRYGKVDNAIEDGEKAQELFLAQNNEEGYTLSARFIQLAQARSEFEANGDDEQGNPKFVEIVNGIATIAPMLLRFFIPTF